jgi:predicted SAM-dependent methyltransferase
MRRTTWRDGESNWGLTSLRAWDETWWATWSVGLAIAHVAMARRTRYALRRRLRRRGGPVYVSLGSGRELESGWIGLDLRPHPPNVYYWDLRRPLPFATASVDGILAEHCFEHLPLDDIAPLLAECHRALGPAGPLRVVSPDARLLARLILGAASENDCAYVDDDRRVHRWQPSPTTTWMVINRLSHQWGQHKALISHDLLEMLLTGAGFADVVSCAPGTTAYFESVPGVHRRRFPNARQEEFAIEARRGSAD